MKRETNTFNAGVALLLVGPVLFAQATPPTPGAGGHPPKSTALIIGEVIDGVTGQPLGDAVVTLTPPGARGLPSVMPAGASPEVQQALQAAAAAMAARGGGPAQQRVLTGGDGRFVFHGLPPGQFQLAASVTGYVPSLTVTVTPALAGVVSGISPTPGPLAVVLREGEFATGVKLRLWKCAVLSGTVLDDGGEPAIGLTVQAAKRVMVSGRARYVPAMSARTDDRGAYRIASLVPGDYLVAIPQAQVSVPSALLSSVIEGLASGGRESGLFLTDVMSAGINPTPALSGGVRIGEFMVASSGSVPLAGPDGRLLAYQTLFHSGAVSLQQASIVTLKPGEERPALDFRLHLIPTARVSGTAVGPEGTVANLGIRLVLPGDSGLADSEYEVASAITNANGRFTFYGVPAGRFILRAVQQPRPEISAEALAAAGAPGLGAGAQGPKEMLFAMSSISVSTGDLDGLALRLVPGLRVSGRLEFQSQSGRSPPTPTQVQAAAILLLPADGRLPNLMAMARPDRANAQAAFQTKGYEPGKYFLTVSGLAGWLLKSATIGGRDVLDAPIEIVDAELSDMVVTLTDRLAQIGGSVIAAGEPDLAETSVLMFPEDYRGWIATGLNSRRARSVRVNRAGAFTIANMLPGEYLLIAVERSTEGELQDPAYVTALARLATRVSVGSDAANVNLTRVRVVR